jgi:hypothetical protein
MLNDLQSDPQIRDRFEFWFFSYETGNPIPYSALQLRRALEQAVASLDPAGQDAALRDMVLIGHSQGGLLAKMTAIETGSRLWDHISRAWRQLSGGIFARQLRRTPGAPATSRTKGTCDNMLTIKREFVEACVLNGLGNHLMDPAYTELFCREYARHLNEARMERSAAKDGARSELAKVTRDLDRLVQAILDGVPGSRVKDRMAELEARKPELEAVLTEAVEEPVLLHPNLSQLYRQQVARLVEALNDEHHRTEAAEIIRGLVDRIVLTPKEDNGQRALTVELRGALAGILSLATNGERPLQNSGLSVKEITLVAGAGFEPATFRL